jgi:hypothetical protein
MQNPQTNVPMRIAVSRCGRKEINTLLTEATVPIIGRVINSKAL